MEVLLASAMYSYALCVYMYMCINMCVYIYIYIHISWVDIGHHRKGTLTISMAMIRGPTMAVL